MKPTLPSFQRQVVRFATALVPLMFAGCGDDYDNSIGNVVAPLSCSVHDRNVWLSGYMNDWYFWYKISPRPDPTPYTSVDSYFSALLYTGTDTNFPADRWSFTQSTQSFTMLYGDGQTLGYGISVAGTELDRDGTQPLYVRYVEALSPAATQGVVRGDQVVSINGRLASDIVTADDYSSLTASSTGQTITLVLRNTGGQRTVTVTSAVFNLSPVANATVVTSPLGRKLGYVVVKDMINQVQSPLETAFAQFKAAGVSDIVLDLRYNGGGLVSVGSLVASYVAGTRGSGHTYASLLYNDKQAAYYNQSFGFSSPSSAASFARVFVLTGPRTCSASEQVINGLRGIGVDVVSVGDTSCGKPVGFLPVDDTCGTTYNAVNFESVNEQNAGRYFDGFDATCAVAEDFTQPMGSSGDPLLTSAAGYADSGSCPLGLPTPLGTKARGHRSIEAGERQGMIAR